ncbi:hypothetical protein AMC87_CH03320 [Rhizobium phaseoli]|uniref:hypothetical protein n=1 Tax=Rhizobium phaseoli TaxID=396 RepID=UPI0007F17216|nr:hypothetical protein [Rhizobium phaseoli]ANL47973.1 hypothetical protein AMC87_CH03320 [Rhizobium phaseoli]PWI53066.1 hypothetical protein B5K03_16945 [Rhizobium phaseoli]
MKSAELFYSREFLETPISGWAGARLFGWVREKTLGGQIKRPRRVMHPFASQRKLWCLLAVHFDGVDLIFATPLELDQFLAVMSQNPLPSGWALIPGQSVGRPNNHWLSRLPKGAKSWKFRQSICRFLRQAGVVREFRDFYAGEPVKLQFDGVFNNYCDAWSRPVA